MLNLDNNVLNGGGAISLQSGTSFPNGQVYGRFFNDTDTSILYFDNGSSWVALGGGTPPTPTLQAVCSAGNSYTNNIVADSFVKNKTYFALTGTNPSFNFANSYFLPASFVGSATITNAGRGYSLFYAGQTSLVNNVEYREFSATTDFNSALVGTSLTFNNTSTSGHFTSEYNFANLNNSTSTIRYVTNFNVKNDILTNGINLTTIQFRYGILISNFRNANIIYTNIYSIYSEGALIPMYHAGIGFFGTLTNLATTNVSMSLGKPINFENSTSPTAGGNSGSHLIVYVNGVQRKIALLNP